ncbi:DUF1109 domain-containing protein [Sphingomonas sp. SUN019]|uniref:DUF1109 domain-containing protein n=1 Tax=Sphingomonas sp. SUN019 TaxID=2937788 RepID=UPI00216486A4|nr:DUF1109 domain-containing protein [Sphingomonas sp. SUN019]UVO50805.1 DUF1109 domain-containing protein [Sphingomonas sp. SUN019]
MRTDALIDALASDLAPVRRRSIARDLSMLGALAAAEITLSLMLGGLRPDWRAASATPVFWWKAIGVGVLSAIGIVAAMRGFAAEGSSRGGLRLFTATLAVVLALGVGLAMGDGSRGDLIARLDWRHGVGCLIHMTVLALPMLAAFVWLARRGAPTDRNGTALAVGAAAAAWGTFVFTFSCHSDDPFYCVFWYLLGCGALTLVARIVVARLIRW